MKHPRSSVVVAAAETGNVSVQSIKQQGDRCHKLSIIPTTNGKVKDILLTFKNTIAKRLNISILNLRDLFQNLARESPIIIEIEYILGKYRCNISEN